MTHDTGSLRRASELATLGAGLLGVALLAGCSGSGGLDTGAASGPPSTVATSSPSTSATISATPTATRTLSATPAADANSAAQAAVAADVTSYLTAFTKSVRIRNARVPDLIRFSTGPRRAIDRANIANMHQQGIVFRGTPRDWMGPVSVVGNRASLHICEKDDTSWYEYASSGKLAGGREHKWKPYEIRVLKRSGRWQVNLLTPDNKFPCKSAS